ncbi:MAG: hypothetical protein Q4D82_01560 [Neisseria sp.]|nr:hypothetical protein [Neisseria sp.]
MKRKIYQTPYGRVMVKIVKATTRNPKTEISVRFKRDLFRSRVSKSDVTYASELTSPHRRFQEQSFKRVDARSAAFFAERAYIALMIPLMNAKAEVPK